MDSWSHGTTVSNVCLQALTLSLLSPRDFFTLSPNREPVHRLRFIDGIFAIWDGPKHVLLE